MTKPEFFRSTIKQEKSQSHNVTFDLVDEIKIFFSFLLKFFLEEETESNARAKFYEKIRDNCLAEYEKYICVDDNTKTINWTLVGVSFILFEPISSFYYLLSERQEHLSKSKKLILSISNCLSLKNQGYLDFISLKNINQFLETERELLKQFIDREITDNLNTAENVYFLRDCSEQLGNLLLKQKLDAALNRLEPDKSSNCEKEKTFQSDTETEGNLYEKARDPPGQRCIYIPPGNTSEENYRLSTFLKYPTNAPVNPRRLATAGFFFTGYKDRVKCFSCGFSVENWNGNDDVMDRRWHKYNCKMMLGQDNGNVAIGGIFSRFAERTNERSPTSANSPTQPTASAQATPVNINAQSGGQVLMQGYGNYVPPRPVHHRPTNQYPNIELATIVSPHHENKIRSLNLNREFDRRKSFDTWRQVPFTVDPVDLVRSGFFYLGNADRVQCFSCGGVLRSWKPQDNVDAEHKKHFPHCRMVNRADARNVPLNGNTPPPVPQPPANPMEEPPNPSPQEQVNLERMFPCLHGVNAHMREESLRLQTFDHRWPSNRVRATPPQISKAGFYYLGDRDRVKCWYCNGGLQNWEPNDEPWSEHAKWFPTCEFLLRSKGPDFVHRVVEENPNVNRPILRSPFDVPPSRSRHNEHRRAPSPPPPILDHKAIRRKIQQELPKAMESEIIKEMEKMGFERSKIRHCVKRKLKRTGKVQDTAAELVEDLTGEISSSSDEEETKPSQQFPAQLEGNEASSSAQPRSNTSSPSSSMTSFQTAPAASVETRMQELQEERLCKVCLDRPADIVFVPCGHLVCCINCASSLRRCPICRAKIDKAIKTYVS